jgi:uroporphyrinogen-III synthase
MSEQKVAALPLQGKRILVTRTREQAGTLSTRLQALGAVPIEFPTIRIVSPSDWTQLDAALHRLYRSDPSTGQDYAYDWLIFTSVNGVRIWLDRVQALGYDPRALAGVRVATIGPATASALERGGIVADLIPGEFVAEGVASALIQDAQERGITLAGKHILLPRAAEARKVLVTELQEVGALVDEVAAYFTVPVAADDERGREVLRLLRERQLDVLTFTSSSTVRNFVSWFKSSSYAALDASPESYALSDILAPLSSLTIASIGPITSQTARELGLHVTIQAAEFTIDGLVSAIVQHEV